MIVRLNQAEMAMTEQAGALRWQLARSAGVTDQVRDKTRDPKAIDRLGVRAEVAFSKAIGLDFQPATLGIDNGGDLYIPLKNEDFYVVQVKSTFHANGNLLFKTNDKWNFNCAALVCAQSDEPECDSFEVTGCLSLNSIKEKGCSKNLGHGETWFVSRDDLLGIEKLWRHIQEKRMA